MKNKKLLIHTALMCEAIALIEKLELNLITKKPYKLYSNHEIILVISGVGKEATISSLEYIYKNFPINSAINIGIAGCSSKEFDIGEIFLVTKNLDGVKNLDILTVDKPCDSLALDIPNMPILVDMEYEYFLETSSKYLPKEKIYSLKIISDYLSATKLPKELIKSLFVSQISVITKTLIQCQK
jgi:hypothetical protein